MKDEYAKSTKDDVVFAAIDAERYVDFCVSSIREYDRRLPSI